MSRPFDYYCTLYSDKIPLKSTPDFLLLLAVGNKSQILLNIYVKQKPNTFELLNQNVKNQYEVQCYEEYTLCKKQGFWNFIHFREESMSIKWF